MLRRVVENREVLAASGADDLPDFLGPWGPESEDAANGAGGRGLEQASTAPTTPHAPTEVAAHPSGGSGVPDTIVGISDLLRRKEISPVELAERALARAGELDGKLNLFQVLLPERALEAARAAEREIAEGRWRGPLHGVPVAVKDLLEMRGTVTTAGSKVRAGRESSMDAAAVAHLEAAGAVIVGKTRLSEFAYWPGSTNPHFGPTRNPHDPQRDAGGSSSGSAAAVAAGVVYAALGTDTGGSIRIPAALCGTVGLKPTFGRASLAGCVPLAWSLDHIGPLTRDVRDAHVVLGALAGPDGRDPRTRRESEYDAGGALREGRAGGARGLRIGVMTGDGSAEPLGTPEAVAAWQASLRALESAGATLVEIDLPEMQVLWRVSSMLLAIEASAYHARTLRERYADYGRFCRGRLVGGFAYGFDDLMRAQRVRRWIRAAWSRHFERVDVLATPCQPGVAPALGTAASTRYTNPFNALGWPAVSVPFGAGEGRLPLGTQLVGRAWCDREVLEAALLLEDLSRS